MPSLMESSAPRLLLSRVLATVCRVKFRSMDFLMLGERAEVALVAYTAFCCVPEVAESTAVTVCIPPAEVFYRLSFVLMSAISVSRFVSYEMN